MKIYTKTGDAGQTSLATGERISKTDARLVAYGTADELNSFVGLLRSKQADPKIELQLEWIQNELFNLGAQLAGAELYISAKETAIVEEWIDDIQNALEPVHAFILPGGSESIALAHVCRTITRRLERNMVSLSTLNVEIRQLDEALRLVNRLSDFWFVLAKKMAKIEKKQLFLWKK